MFEDSRLIPLGSEILKQVAIPITETEFGSTELQKLTEELFSVLNNLRAQGVAAPQIGVSKQVFVMGPKERKDTQELSDEDKQAIVVINPKITVIDERLEENYEGCLSVGEICGIVPRARKIKLEYQNVNGEFKSKICESLVARIVQHECDHLNGILFLERVVNPKTYIHVDLYRKIVS